MNSNIALYISGLIDTLPFVDKIAAMTAPLTYKEGGVTRTYPVACGVQHRDCIVGKYDDLVPNSRYKSVIYFEDQGVTFGKVSKDRQQFTSRLRLVVWLNLQKLGETGCNIAGDVILSIMASIPEFPVNYGTYLQLNITPVSQPIRNRGIFDRYTYSEEQNQYLMYPYDYFAIDFNCTWWMVNACVTPYTPGQPIACPTQPA